MTGLTIPTCRWRLTLLDSIRSPMNIDRAARNAVARIAVVMAVVGLVLMVRWMMGW